MYRLNEAKTACEASGRLTCKPGYYGRDRGGYFVYPCDKCPTGTYRNNDNYSNYACQSCPEGSYVNADQSNCVTVLPPPTPPPTSAPTK